MVTQRTLSDPLQAADTIEMMIVASEAICCNLVETRDKWRAHDVEIARLIDALRIQFEAFAAAARAGQVGDLMTLRTIGRCYEIIAESLHELALTDVNAPRDARAWAGEVACLTARIREMMHPTN